MYMKKMVEIGKATNGYVIECRVPIKEKEKNGMDSFTCHKEQQYIAKDMDEVGTIITKLMPLLDADYTSEDEFDNAFEKAAK